MSKYRMEQQLFQVSDADNGSGVKKGDPESQALPSSEAEAEGWDRFPETIEGIDIEAGLKRLRNNRLLYRKLLITMGQRYGAEADQLLSLCLNRRFDDLAHRIHTIKGVGGNLGATSLYSAAKRVEWALADGSSSMISETINTLVMEMRCLSDTLSVLHDCQPGDLSKE